MKQKRNSAVNSSNKKANGVLAAPSWRAEARKLLLSVANLQDSGDSFDWFKKQFPYLIEDVVSPTVLKEAVFIDPDESFPYYGTASKPIEKWKYWILPLRATLRAIWRAPDRRTKEWGMFRISQDFFSQGQGDLIHAPLDGSFDLLLVMKPRSRTERLILELLKWSELTRYCDNPDCPAPFFIASRTSQKYCSRDCAEPAQRECKRRWWARHGTQRRAAKHSKLK